MEPAALAGLILVVGITVFLLMGAPISVGVGLSATLAMFVILGVENGVLTSAQRMFNGVNSFALLAIPFFVLAGGIMNNGGIAERLINLAKILNGRPCTAGGSVQTSSPTCCSFAGSSVLGCRWPRRSGRRWPRWQAKDGYDKGFSAATNVASAPSGWLILKEHLLIIYASPGGTWISAPFMAGYIPA